MSRTPEDLLSFTSEALERVRSQVPLVHCITNSVVVNFTANALLAVGAAGAMVDIPDEAGGLLVNLGTPTAEQRVAMAEAAGAANAAGTPWALDPVAVGALDLSVYLVTDTALVASRGRDVVDVVAEAVAGGVTVADVAPLRVAGAAIVSGIRAAADPRVAAREFADAWTGAA